MYFGVLNRHLQGVSEVSSIDQIFIEYVVTSVLCTHDTHVVVNGCPMYTKLYNNKIIIKIIIKIV
jgi:hypothetical protein